MNVQEFCQKYGITEAQFYGAEKIEGSINLASLTTMPEGCNLTAEAPAPAQALRKSHRGKSG